MLLSRKTGLCLILLLFFLLLIPRFIRSFFFSQMRLALFFALLNLILYFSMLNLIVIMCCVSKLDRRVSCKDLGRGDCEGWLYKRKQKDRTLSKHWDKRWCVLKKHVLYYYKQKDVSMPLSFSRVTLVNKCLFCFDLQEERLCIKLRGMY